MPLKGDYTKIFHIRQEIFLALRRICDIIGYVKLHVHAISVHLPAGLFPAAAIFLILYLITGNASFEITSFFLLLIAFLGTLIGFISGLYDRWKHFTHWAPIFVRKTSLSILLLIFSGICISYRGFTCFKTGTISLNLGIFSCSSVVIIIILPVLTALLVYYGLLLSYGKFGGRASYGKPILYQLKEEEAEEDILGRG